jgi:1-acyl-sn-glycerol-3-phosphate acyltransferase
MIRSLVLLASFIVLGLLAAVVVIPWAMITGNAAPLYNVSQWIIRAGLFMARVHVRVEGRERVPAGRACIFMANHVSNLDPPVLLPLIPGRTSVFIKRSLTKIPILGYGFKLGEFIPVKRDGRPESARVSMAAARALLQKGLHITIFVEGTRSPDGRLLPFKKGPFYLGMNSGAPCVPISIFGTETMMGKGSLRILPGTARVVFHEPLDPANYKTREELMAAVRASIASGLPEWMRG